MQSRVVSSRWSSQDDAFTKVVSTIRQVVERFQASPPVAAPASETGTGEPERTAGKQPVEREYREGDWMDDSGAAVLIGDQCYESESVTDQENGRVEVKIAPLNGAEEAALRSFQSDRHGSSREVSFAHRNHGFVAQVRSARSQSVAGRTVWTLELDADARQRNAMDDITVGKITADQIASARARLLLLGEQPKGHLREAESFITGGSVFGGRKARSGGSIFPNLWQKSAGDIVKFLRWARLFAVFTLKTTNICQHVLSLKLSLKEDAVLAVGFTGQRQSLYSNEVIKIAVSGDCTLQPQHSRDDNPRD